MPVVYLRKGNLARLARGHPWIYANEVAKVIGEPKDGEVVKVSDHRQRPLGCGFFNSKSQILVRRVIRRESVDVNAHAKAGCGMPMSQPARAANNDCVKRCAHT